MARFCNDKYVASHAKNPRGCGFWWFGNRDESWTFNVNRAMSLVDAKKVALIEAKKNNVSVIYVLP